MEEKLLYHYCPTEKCFAILDSKNLRMSDIGKSNDYTELSLLFPAIFDELENLYRDTPFNFEYDQHYDLDAMLLFLNQTYRYWDQQFFAGAFYNYVICFSEDPDSLSQWRGYADDAKGCAIGFSKDLIQQYCDNTNGVLELAKITYLKDADIDDLTYRAASKILNELKSLRKIVVNNFTRNNLSPETDIWMKKLFNYKLEAAFIDSLRYKAYAFHEEQEWRIFLKLAPPKADLASISPKDVAIEGLYQKTVRFIQERIDFSYKEDDVISFCPIRFEEFEQNPVKQLWLGPKNKARINDIDLYMKKNNYNNVNLRSSFITYR